MSIICDKLKKLWLDNNLTNYLMNLDKIVSKKSEVEWMTLGWLKSILKWQWYKSVEEWLTDIYKKSVEMWDKELTSFIWNTKKWQEVKNIIESNTMWYIRNTAESVMMNNTIEKLENLLKEWNKYVDNYKGLFKKNELDLKAIDYQIVNEKNSKWTKVYHYDPDLEYILERYKKNKQQWTMMLKNYINRLKEKQSIKKAEAFMEWSYGYDIWRKQVDFMEEKNLKTFFMEKSTLDRNFGRIKANWEYKKYSNLYEIYHWDIYKYNDFIKALSYQDWKNIIEAENNVKSLVDELNNHWSNVMVEYSDWAWTFLLKNKDTWLSYIYNWSALQNDRDNVIKYFTEVWDSWEMSWKQLTDVSKKVDNWVEPDKIEKGSIDKALKYIDEFWKDIDPEVAIDLVDKTKKELTFENENALKLLTNVETLVPWILWKEVDKLNLYHIWRIFVSNTLARLQTNQEYIKWISPELHQLLTSANLVSEQNIADRMTKIFNMFDTLKNHGKSNKIVADETKYAALELLSQKELEDWWAVNLIENAYTTFKREHPSATEDDVMEHLSDVLAQYNQWDIIWRIKWFDNTVIKDKIQDNLSKLQKSRTNWYKAWYVWYILSKYHPEEAISGKLNNIMDLEKIANEYYEWVKKYVPNLHKETFIEEFSKSLFNSLSTKKNLIDWIIWLRSSFKDLDNALSKSVLNEAQRPIIVWNSYIWYWLKQVWESDSVIKRIVEDMHWTSLYWAWKLKQMYWKLKWIESRLLLASFWPKWIWISAQGLFTWITWAYTRFAYNPEISTLIWKEIGKLKDDKELWIYLSEIFNPWETQIDKWLEESNEWFTNKILYKLSDITWKNVRKWWKALEKVAFWLPWMVDDLVYKAALKDRILSKIYQEKGISKEQMKDLVDKIKGWDTQAREDFKDLLTDVRKEALEEYQTFFKTAYNTWLIRNNFSRLWWINFFGSWGSKMSWEYIFHMFLEPLHKAAITLKYTDWNKTAAMEAFMTAFASSDRTHAFLKQLYLWYKMSYEMHKDDNIDWDPIEILKNTTLAYQWLISNVISRAIMNSVSQYQDTDWAVKDKLFAGAVMWVKTLLKNVFRESQMIWSLAKEYWAIAVKWWDMNDLAFVSKYWLLNNITNSANFTMYDSYNWELMNRFDWKWKYWLLETLLWFNLTKWSDEKEEIMHYMMWEKIKANPMKSISDIWSLALLWSNWLLDKQLKNHKLWKILDSDNILKTMTDKWYVPDELYNDNKFVKWLWKLIWQSDLMNWWTLDSTSWVEANKLSLVFNQLRDKWINVNTIVSSIQSNLLNHKEQDILKLTSLIWSKAWAASLVAYATQKLYKQKQYELKRIYWKNIPDNVLERTKAWIYRLMTPTLMRLDKHFHAGVLWLYIKNRYIDNDTTWQYKELFWKGISKEMKVKLFSEVVDLDKVDWDNSKLRSYPVMLSTWLSKDKKIDLLNKIYWWIDNSWASYWAKLTAQAWTLYANFSQIKDIIASDPSKFWWAAERLADIIWTTDDKITKDPNFLDWVIRSNWWTHKVKWTKIKIPRVWKAKAIKQAVSKLKWEIIKNPYFKDYISQKTHKQIHTKLSPFTYNLPKDEFSITRTKLKWFNPWELRTKVLETRSKYLKSKRVRKPKVSNVEKVLRKTKSSSKDRKSIKPSRINR